MKASYFPASAAAVCLLWFLATPALGNENAEFVCDDGAGGKVICLLEREDKLTRITCKRGTLFEVKWLCSVFPDSDAILCRSRTGGQRVFKPEEFQDEAFVCTSVCFCPKQ